LSEANFGAIGGPWLEWRTGHLRWAHPIASSIILLLGIGMLASLWLGKAQPK
jgi:hypothetical protein